MPHFDPAATVRAWSRRDVLRAAGGLVLAPALAPLVGCQRKAIQTNAEEAPTATLTASAINAAPDGVERQVWSYNGGFPGPTLRAKEGDKLRIKVVNQLKVPTTIHWHGMHQPGTWRMDGVEEVSQVPIAPGADMIYEFTATPAGTHWYHAHVGVQYGDGLFGPLLIEERTPIATYDREETLLMNDWFHELGDVLLARLLKPNKMKMKMPAEKADKMDMKMDYGDVPFQSGLINGKGRAKGDTKSPLTVVELKKGETVRLRLINGSSAYALRFQIDGHPLTVIASDGMPLRPVVVANLQLGVGESYDVLLKADQEGAFWIRAVTGDGNEILAILRYAGSQRAEPEPGAVTWGPRALSLEQMRSPQAVDLAAEGPREIPMKLGGSMMPYRWSVNEQFYPKADPIALQKDELVRMTFSNPTMMDHPFHLHGHSFYILGKPGELNLKDPPLKDTINVPAKSDLVIQWKANNAGRWFFHCHIEWHLAAGMARVLEIKPY
jgi:FtsP/CotA-like multicopper oxidase with cupredoxin domain